MENKLNYNITKESFVSFAFDLEKSLIFAAKQKVSRVLKALSANKFDVSLR